MQGPWVQILVRELKSHMLCGVAKKKFFLILNLNYNDIHSMVLLSELNNIYNVHKVIGIC